MKVFFKINKVKILGFLFISLLLPLSSVQADSIGQKTDFFVDPTYDYLQRTQIEATLKQISRHAYFYVENSYWQKLSFTDQIAFQNNLNKLATEFDQIIYPTMTSVFGSEWKPGIDNDERITILITQLKTLAGGYFNPVDEYPRSQINSSNQREMIYLNAVYMADKREPAFLAHEFQHLISYNQKEIRYHISDDIWLNEARSEYAPTLCGYDKDYYGSNLEKRVKIFLKYPSDSLTEWSGSAKDYGSINLFIHYLVDHYGKDILTKIMETKGVGIASINNALTVLGQPLTFSDIFVNWSVANYLNNCSVSPVNLYCYLEPNLNYDNLHIQLGYLGAAKEKIESSNTIKDWSAQWFEFKAATDIDESKNVLKIEFSSNDPRANFRVPYVIKYKDGHYEVREMTLIGQKGSAFVKNFGTQVSLVAVIPSNHYKTSNFTANEPLVYYNLNATLVKEAPIPSYPDGTLIRAKGDYKVYIIKGRYKRWIQTPQIFDFYGHLSWQKIVEVTPEERDYYITSWLVRADNDYKVYEINGDGTKHWLNMTAQQFVLTGHFWDMVYLINQKERDWYQTGSDVLYRQ